jgi:5'-nucleotidase
MVTATQYSSRRLGETAAYFQYSLRLEHLLMRQVLRVRSMRILLSNDDGYQAPGLLALAAAVSALAEIQVVAPERNRSGASNSLTLDYPIHAELMENGFVRVDGTPTDCVHLAITGLLKQEPDMVIAGINAGANMGDDVLYSGTVAAATEGRFLGLPAIAMSMNSHSPEYYATGARVAAELVARLQKTPLAADSIINVNVPDLPYEALKGYRVTRLGHRHKAEPVVRSIDPRGRTIYWVGPAGAEQDAGPGTDFHAVREGYVSVTPLQVDLTRHSSLEEIGRWLNGAAG